MIQLNPLFLFVINSTPDSRPLLGLDPQMFIDMLPNLGNFIALAIIITWLLYKPVLKILNARAERVEGDIKDAALSKASAEELKGIYMEKVKGIESERADIMDEARKMANEKRTQILAEAKAEAQDVKDRAARDVANELEQIKGTVHQIIVDVSTDMAAKLISATVSKKAHETLFDEAMAELEATTLFEQEKEVVTG